MKVVIAPDKFAGTLTAAQAARAMRDGWLQARPGDEVVLAPMADGGEGMTDVLLDVIDGAQARTVQVADARGEATEARWVLLPDGVALIECAQACGLSRLEEDQRDPLVTTTYGVGQLLADARDAGAERIIVGLGGSATNDGGGGMVTALGHRLLRADGNGVKVGGGFLHLLDRAERGPDLEVPVVAAVDVNNPLLGPRGATAVFGPQKGGRPEALEALERGMAIFADVVERDLPGGPWRDVPGAGAAGGLGFGLLAFCDAEIRGGAEVVAELVGFAEALPDAQVVLTGEGKLDAQSQAGKAPAFVRDVAFEAGARVLAVCGQVADGAGEAFSAWRELGPDGMTRAAELVRARTAELAREISPGA